MAYYRVNTADIATLITDTISPASGSTVTVEGVEITSGTPTRDVAILERQSIQTITTGVATQIQLNVATLETGATTADTANYRFVIGADGTYFIGLRIYFGSGGTNIRESRILINGTLVAKGNYLAPNGTDNAGRTHWIGDCSQNDLITFVVYHTRGSNVSIGFNTFPVQYTQAVCIRLR